MGSAGVASIVATVTFWILVVYGSVSEDLSRRATIGWVLFWMTGVMLAGYIPYGTLLFPSVVAVADIALVFTLFEGDVRFW